MAKVVAAYLVVAGLVPLIFINIADKRVAGLIAGTCFLAVGLFAFWHFWRREDRFHRPGFYFTAVFISLIVLPMLISRFLFWSTPFAEMNFYLMTGATFHRLSTVFYMLLIAVLVKEWFYERSQLASKANA